LETSGAPGAFSGVLTEDATFATEEAGALDLVAGVEAAGFGAIPRPDTEDVAVLATGLLTVTVAVEGLLVEVVEDGVVCFGVPFVDFGAGADLAVGGLFTVIVTGAGVDEACFWTAGATFGVVFAIEGSAATVVLLGAGGEPTAEAGVGTVGLMSAILICYFRREDTKEHSDFSRVSGKKELKFILVGNSQQYVQYLATFSAPICVFKLHANTCQ
jgi:hypothetical protein